MTTIKKTLSLAILALFILCNKAVAQNFAIDPMYYQIFDRDSLAGFDETAARASAISEQFYGSEFKIKMYRLKREYIDNKYNLVKMPVHNNTTNYLTANRPAAISGCVNEDFEASTAAVITTTNQIAGWTISGGYNSSISSSNTTSLITYYPGGISGVTSCNLIGCCPMPPLHSELIDCSAPGGYVDTQIGNQYPIYSVFGSGTANAAAGAVNPQISGGMFGSKVLRLNDGVTGDYSMQKLSKTFSVTASNALFQFAFISVFSPGHGCCDAGAFQIRLTNATANTVIACPSFSVSAPSTACTATVPINYLNVGTGTTYSPTLNFGNIYHPWKVNSIDMTPYIGQNITIDIIASDCTAGGHFGKVYFDAQCGPMTIYGNGNPYAADITNVIVPTCGAAGATICASDGLGPYSWAGPGVGPPFNTPALSNQCFTTNISATYTLYMQPQGACFPISRVVTSTITPAPLLTAGVVQAVCGSSLAIVTITPSGSAQNPSTINWSPTPLSLTTNTMQGTYTIQTTPFVASIVASDPLGCKVTATVTVNPAPPIPTFTILNITGSPSITCTYPSINLDISTLYNYGGNNLSYFWATNSATFTTANITALNPGTYTCQGYDSVTGCSSTQTIAIGVNTIAPAAVISPTVQNINCTNIQAVPFVATSNPTVNVTQIVSDPLGGSYSNNTHTISYLPGAVGEYTYTVRNDVNGCTTVKHFTVNSNQGFPTFSVVSAQNFTLGCNSKSVATIVITNASGTNSLQIPNGGPVSYTLLSPTSSTVTPPGVLSGTNTYSINTPGTWTVITKDNTSLCETRLPISILSNTFAPNISATFTRQILDCYVPFVKLQGQSTSDNISYNWSFPGTPGNMPNDTVTVAALLGSPSTTLVANYTLTVLDNSSTCKSTSVVPIYQNLFVPKAIISNGGTQAISCKTSSVMLTNQSTTGIPPNSIFTTNQPVVGSLWSGPTPQEPLSNSSTYLALTIGTYTMMALDLNNGCSNYTTSTIIDNLLYPDTKISPPTGTLYCGSTAVLNATTANVPLSNLSYTWAGGPANAIVNGQFTSVFTTSMSGEYHLVVYNTNSGCQTEMDVNVITGSLTAKFEPDVTSGYPPLKVNFRNLSKSSDTTNITSIWSFGNSNTTTLSSVASTTAMYTVGGTYTVTLYARKGTCLESAQHVITVEVPSKMVVPNVFTPNGDGVNDFFFLEAKSLSEISVLIYDRWGHKIYEVISEKGNIVWDGKNQLGKEVAEGTYFYIIKATGKDGANYDKNGTINIFR